MSCEEASVSELWSQQHSMIKLLNFEGVSPKQIFSHLKNLYGDATVSVQHIRKWCHHFQACRTDVKGSLHSGQRKTSHTNEFKVKVAELIEEDDSITIREIAVAVGIAYGMVRQIIHDDLHVRKICAC